MANWTFITKYGMVLLHIAKKPQTTANEIAALTNVTERTVHNIINDLVQEGYIQ
jgi:DNA-binding MarR family transcriptional regulator